MKHNGLNGKPFIIYSAIESKRFPQSLSPSPLLPANKQIFGVISIAFFRAINSSSPVIFVRLSVNRYRRCCALALFPRSPAPLAAVAAVAAPRDFGEFSLLGLRRSCRRLLFISLGVHRRPSLPHSTLTAPRIARHEERKSSQKSGHSVCANSQFLFTISNR